jgi:hypothetical protein
MYAASMAIANALPWSYEPNAELRRVPAAANAASQNDPDYSPIQIWGQIGGKRPEVRWPSKKQNARHSRRSA